LTANPSTRDRIAPARRVAFDLLLELRRRPESHSDGLLRSKAVEELSGLDRNLATTLVMGVLRWRILLAARIAAVLTRANDRLLEPVEVALELGALQLLLLDRIPAHAAIFESVELTKESGNAHAAGMVNAVLRKLVNAPKLETEPARTASAGEIARVYAHPMWMVTRWAKAYGEAQAAAICRFDQQPPPVTIRLLDLRAEALLREEGVKLEAGSFVEQARHVVQGEITSTRAFAERLVRIQDEGSQLIAELAAGAHPTVRSAVDPSLHPALESILDCCAAPGGKTAILAERHPQAEITACDISPSRLKTMRSFLSRQNREEQISFRVLDATELPGALSAPSSIARQFDLALCDAPCSGTGTLARNPEIRHRITLEGLRRQHERQVKLLLAGMKSLAPGGRLVYSTCSLEAEENESVVAEALAGQKDFRLLSWKDGMLALEAKGVLHAGTADRMLGQDAADEFLRILPGVHPCDGFFAALIARSS
jgi:16S rRNA (cytosine967-C5)-methyltransferase